MSTIPETEADDIHDPDFKPTVDLKEMKLSPIVLGRVKALKNLQMNAVKVETEYYKEILKLDMKYQAKYEKHYQQMAKVISGAHEPSGDELEWVDDVEDVEQKEVDKDGEDKDAAELSKRKKIDVFHPDFPADAKGLPKFWLHTLKNANEESLLGLIEPVDEPVLEYMTDLTIALHPDTAGFTLNFYFALNPYFTNKVLIKEYTLREGPDPTCPLKYDGPEIIACKGCTIDWKKGMDVTKTDDGKTYKSFFTFFCPPVVKDGDGPEAEKVLSVDYDVGFAIKEKIIPRSVVYFTGEIFRDDDEGVEEEVDAKED